MVEIDLAIIIQIKTIVLTVAVGVNRVQGINRQINTIDFCLKSASLTEAEQSSFN